MPYCQHDLRRKRKQLTVASSKTHEEITGVNNIANGGWSMRSQRHHYSAKSEVAMIKRQQTKNARGTKEILQYLWNCHK